MALTKEEFQQRIQAIGSCEDDVERRTLLADLSEDGSAIFDDYAAMETERNAARDDNEKLRAANMKLFLKVGDPEKGAGSGGEPPKKMKFEDLFDEKGGIK